MNNVKLDSLPINWFDFVVVIMLLLGANKGRKNGMSQELMVCLQWCAIVIVGAYLYLPLGDALADMSPMSRLFCYITTYVCLAILIKTFFGFIKKATGGKLTDKDIFGHGEYYLGMVAGSLRFLFILMAGLALLNARLYTTQEVRDKVAYQKDLYGSTFFPDLNTLQTGVFKESFCGKYYHEYASFLLIKPTLPESKSLGGGRRDAFP